jgi:CDP-diacylglycerol--glycerol-3-phosphate 3-phosphatidyltransferase
MKIPNILTSLRIVLIPVFVLAFYLPFSWAPVAAATIFALAAVTDWFDGYLARKLNQQSPFGAFLDPVADKLMVAAALVVVVEQYDAPMVTIPAAVIIGREIVISALREWMAELGKRASVAVSYVGKVKTTLQMGAIFFMVLAVPGSTLAWGGVAMLYVAALLTLWSMVEYLKAAWPDLTEDL